jgi:two-component system sensor histidine kinase FlrB
LNNFQQPTSTGWTDLLTDMVDSMPAGVLLLSQDGVIVIANRRAAGILGADLAGRRLEEVLRSQELEAALDTLVPLARSHRASKIVVTQNQLENGLFVAIVQDITEHDIDTLDRAEHSKLHAIGNVAARLAHQMRTPLAAALLNAERIARRTTDDALRATASSLLSQMTTLNARVDALLRFVRGTSLEKSKFSVGDALKRVIYDIAPAAKSRSAQMTLTCVSDSQAFGNPDDFRGAITGVIENALEAGATAIEIAEREAGGIVTITVRDNGAGLSEVVAKAATAPFFTTKAHGTGLGLSIARETFTELGGDVQILHSEVCTTVLCTLKAA